jgi:hypothetical protein
MTRDFYGDCIKLGIPVTPSIEVRMHERRAGLGWFGNHLEIPAAARNIIT